MKLALSPTLSHDDQGDEHIRPCQRLLYSALESLLRLLHQLIHKVYHYVNQEALYSSKLCLINIL